MDTREYLLTSVASRVSRRIFIYIRGCRGLSAWKNLFIRVSSSTSHQQPPKWSVLCQVNYFSPWQPAPSSSRTFVVAPAFFSSRGGSQSQFSLCVVIHVGILLLLVWHAPLGVRSAKRRHQSPEWTILSHSYRLIQWEIVWSQVLLASST